MKMTNDKIEEAIINYSKRSGIELHQLRNYLTDGRFRGIIECFDEEAEKEINDLKEENLRLNKVIDEYLRVWREEIKYKKEQTSKKVEELKKELCLDKNEECPVKRCLISDPSNLDKVYCRNCKIIDEIFTPSEIQKSQINERLQDEQRIKDELETSPEEDFVNELNSEQEKGE